MTNKEKCQYESDGYTFHNCNYIPNEKGETVCNKCGNKPMTNNNWIEHIELCLQSENPREQINRYIQSLLTKKDQEHKAELESISKEICSKFVRTIRKEGEEHYNEGLSDADSILDSHINKTISPSSRES